MRCVLLVHTTTDQLAPPQYFPKYQKKILSIYSKAVISTRTVLKDQNMLAIHSLILDALRFNGLVFFR